MINVNEVRLGNWFDISAPSSIWKKENDGSVTQIIRAKYGQVELIRKDSVLVGGFHSKDFGEPIPLTPEILVKCGFKKTGAYSKIYELALEYGRLQAWTGEDQFVCHTIEVNDLEYDTHSKRFVYLHQLQNFFYFLTGTELEFKPE